MGDSTSPPSSTSTSTESSPPASPPESSPPGTSPPVITPSEPSFTAITTQEDFDRAIGPRLAQQAASLRKSISDEVKADLKRAADEAAKKEQGDFKALYEKAEDERKDLDAKLKARELADRRVAIAAKHHLPSWLADRLNGETDEELDEDAKKLATAAKEREVDTDAGKRSKANGSPVPPARPFTFGGTGPSVPRPGYEDVAKKE